MRSELDYYVYLYVDPTNDDEVFYVGKGQGNRAFSHTADDANPELAKRIKRIARKGKKHRVDILMHGIPSSEEALRIETAAIDLLEVKNLTNQKRGRASTVVGRMDAPALGARYGDRQADITDPVLLIRINQLYRFGMSPQELYEATRGVWRMGPRREGAKYACAVFQGVVLEVFEIHSWHPGGTTRYSTRDGTDWPERWEFVGSVAPKRVQERYVNRSVESYFRRNLQSPVLYVNC